VRDKLRFLRYLLFKKAEAQSIEQEEAEKTEIAHPGESALDIRVYLRSCAVQNFD